MFTYIEIPEKKSIKWFHESCVFVFRIIHHFVGMFWYKNVIDLNIDRLLFTSIFEYIIKKTCWPLRCIGLWFHTNQIKINHKTSSKCSLTFDQSSTSSATRTKPTRSPRFRHSLIWKRKMIHFSSDTNRPWFFCAFSCCLTGRFP